MSSSPTASQEAQSDDLFTGYLSTMNSTDFSMQSQFSASTSPVPRDVTTPFRRGTLQTSSSSPPVAALQASKFSDSRSLVREKGQSRSEKLISNGGPSPFATTLQSASEPSIINTSCGEDVAFPKTIKSDKNIEVLIAWKSITSHPKFKVCFSLQTFGCFQSVLMSLCRKSISVLCVPCSPIKHVAMVLKLF